jgi:hypothetical protein
MSEQLILIKNEQGGEMVQRSERKNAAWGECVRKLLEKHHLTYRDAESVSDVSYSTIYGWARYDKSPEYDSAVKFLTPFPEDRVDAIGATGLPIPKDWLKELSPVEMVEIQLRGLLDNGELGKIKAALEGVEKERETE